MERIHKVWTLALVLLAFAGNTFLGVIVFPELCLNLLSVAVIYKAKTKSNLREKRLCFLQLAVCHEWKSGQEHNAGIETEAMEKCCLLIAFYVLFKWLSYTSQDYLPRDGTILS